MERLQSTERHESQRGYFTWALYNEMITNPDIWVVTADLGFGQFDRLRKDFPDRFLNVGASELTAVGVGIGLSYQGKIPFVYTISSFYMRAAEPISLYLAQEKAPVILLGGGRDQDYTVHDGMSHDADIVQRYMDMIGLDTFYPKSKEEASELVPKLVTLNKPCFVSLCR